MFMESREVGMGDGVGRVQTSRDQPVGLTADRPRAIGAVQGAKPALREWGGGRRGRGGGKGAGTEWASSIGDSKRYYVYPGGDRESKELLPISADSVGEEKPSRSRWCGEGGG